MRAQRADIFGRDCPVCGHSLHLVLVDGSGANLPSMIQCSA